MATQYASRLALIVFAASAADRLWSTSDLSAALAAVLAHTAVFYVLGLVCGELARRIVEEDAERAFAQGTAANATESVAGD